MASVKAWKFNDSAAPKYSSDFDIVKRAVLQVTDIKNNNNKYYGIELHQAKGQKADAFRVFTHYGRTDDLETNPDAGAKECRFFDTLAEAEGEYGQIYKSKTGASKGYKEVALASSKIGSQKARGGSSGDVDDKTLAYYGLASGGGSGSITGNTSTANDADAVANPAAFVPLVASPGVLTTCGDSSVRARYCQPSGSARRAPSPGRSLSVRLGSTICAYDCMTYTEPSGARSS
jgi:predicted DNA-binding WGR domain protein